MKRSIVIAGYYGFGNAGDEAILQSMVADLRSRGDFDFVVLSGNPRDTITRHGVHAISRDSIDQILAEIRRADLVIVGGGGLFHDYWEVVEESVFTRRHGGLWLFLEVLAAAALVGTPSMLYAVGVGPVARQTAKRQTRVGAELSTAITVRDEESLDALRKTGVSAEVLGRTSVAADPALGLSPAPAPDVADQIRDIGLDPSHPLLGVSLRHWDFGIRVDDWSQSVAAALDRALESAPPSTSVLMLPFQSVDGEGLENDVSVLERVRASMKSGREIRVAPANLPPSMLSGMLGHCRAALVMRYHAALFALRTDVPTVALAYDPKVRHLMRTFGAESAALSPSHWEVDAIAGAVEKALRPAPSPHPAVISHEALVSRSRSSADIAARLVADPGTGRRSEGEQFVSTLCLRTISRAASLDEIVIERGLQVENLVRERDSIRDRLSALEASTAVRLVQRFWAVVNRALPEGTRRRRLYERLRGTPVRDRGSGGFRRPSSPRDREAVGQTSAGHQNHPIPSALREFEQRTCKTEGDEAVLIFSGTRLDPNQGQRPTQLALEMARRGIPVVFCYWRWNLLSDRPQVTNERILQLPHDELLPWMETLSGVFPERRRSVVFEWPHPSLVDAVARLNSRGWITVYDVLDDWEGFAEGGEADWYDEAFEAYMAAACDAVTVVSRPLTDRLMSLGRPDPRVVPNGVDLRVAEAGSPIEREPADLVAGYFGCLSKAWFDWNLVLDAAERRRSWSFQIIGYGYDAGDLELPSNVSLLGEQPQHELANFAAAWDVGIVPFRSNTIAAMSDPIKTYEYLAMGLPVVTTGVPVPPEADVFVRKAETVSEFVDEMQRAHDARRNLRSRCRAFAAGCTWARRVDTMLALVEQVAEGTGRVKGLL